MIEPNTVTTPNKELLKQSAKHIFSNPIAFTLVSIICGFLMVGSTLFPSKASGALEFLVGIWVTVVAIEVAFTTHFRSVKFSDIISIPVAATKGTVVVVKEYLAYIALIVVFRVIAYTIPEGTIESIFWERLKFYTLPFTFIDFGMFFVLFMRSWLPDLYVSSRMSMFNVDTSLVTTKACEVNKHRLLMISFGLFIAVIFSKAIPYSGALLFVLTAVFVTKFSMETFDIKPPKKKVEQTINDSAVATQAT